MNNFLLYFQQIYYYNPDFQISNKTLYAGLMNYGYTNEELKNNNISNHFIDWINRFSNVSNLDVFYTDRQKGFLQFQNKKDGFDYKCVKLYLSYPKDKIYACANKIFDYIQRNDFKTLSKISDITRSDSIVLRMESIEDARKVMSFINNDPELVQNAKSTNPFSVREGVVGIAYDDMLSFNGVLSKLMSSYFQKHRNQNTFGNVSIDDFKNYVSMEYSRIFKDASNIQNFNISSEDIRRCRGNSGAILNYEQVYKTILMSLDGRTNYNDILFSINNYKDRKNNNVMLDYYNSVLKSRNYNIKNNTVKFSSVVDNHLQYAKNIVDNYILHAANKYGRQNISKYLNDYMRGNQNAITRDNNYRNLFIENVSIERLQEITDSNLEGYIAKICNQNSIQNEYQNSHTNTHQGITISDIKNILDGYILLATTKYGVSNVSKYLNDYMIGNQNAITRAANYRNLFIEYVSPSLISVIIGNDIESYIHNVALQYSNQDEFNQAKTYLTVEKNYMI